MASIADYEKDVQRALIDAASEPSLRRFIDPGDLEVVTVDLGDGTQVQAQAVARGAVRRVIDRIIAQGRQAGIDIKDWICSPTEFDLCSKLNTPVGELMRKLDAFLKNKWTQGGMNAAGLVTLFTAPTVGIALTIFGAIGFANHVFVDLCQCSIPV